MQTVLLKPLYHRGQESIGVYFPKSKCIDLIVKKLPAVKWSQTNKCWYIPLNKEAHNQLTTELKAEAMVDNSALKIYLEKKERLASTIVAKPENSSVKTVSASPAWSLSNENLIALEKFVQQLKLKAYSLSTIRTYRNEFLQLLQLLKNKPVNGLTPDDLKRYFIYCSDKLHLTENTLHSRINAIKFYYEQVLKQEKFFWEIPRPKKQQQLPRFFSQDEIACLLRSVSNVKHKTMLMLAYSSGLRVSEVVSIKCRDIDSRRMCILVKQAKGKKDRMVGLSPLLLIMLREYWKEYKPEKDSYLFEGQAKNEPYSTRSMQLVLTAAKAKAGIIKTGSVHALRHSFATHLLDKGTDVTMIMKLLGHNDIRTTLRYLHVTNRDLLQVISPLDSLNLG